MKKIVSFLVCFALSYAVFAQPTDKVLSKVPSNTPVMMSFNFSHFLEKVSTDQIKSYKMVQYAYKNMKKSAGKDSAILKKLYVKPKAYGLDVRPSAVLFINYDTTLPANKMIGSPVVGFSVPLSSSKKFEKLLIQTMKEKYLDFVEKRDGYKVYQNKGFAFAFDKKSLVFVGSKKETIANDISNIMTLTESSSVLGSQGLKSAISNEGDICMGVDLPSLMGIFKKATADEFKKQNLNVFNMYKYSLGESYSVFNFDNGALKFDTKTQVAEEQKEVISKLSKESVNKQFIDYLPEGKVYGGISVASNIGVIKAYFDKEGKPVFDSLMVFARKEGVKELVKKDSSVLALKENYWADTTTWEQRKAIDKKVDVRSDELFDEKMAEIDQKIDSSMAEYGLSLDNVWGVFKGDFLLAMTGTKEIVDTFKTYDYIENEAGEYEYLEVEKTKLQKIPAFRSFATITNLPVFKTVLDSLVAKKMLMKPEGGVYKIDVPQLNLSLSLHHNILCFSNDAEFVTNYFVEGKKEQNVVSGEAKSLLFDYNSSLFINVESIVDMLGEDAKKDSLAMFTELTSKNFSKISVTSKMKEGYSQSEFKIGMKSDRNSFLQLMDIGNELFLKFSGNKF